MGEIASENAQVIIVTSGGEKAVPRALRFEAKTINPQATPTAKGVAAIKMLDDPIIGGAIAEPKSLDKGYAVVVTDKGYIKRIALEEFPIQGRGGQGVQLWKINQSTGLISGFTVVSTVSTDVDIYSQRGKRLRMAVKDLPEASRAAKGVDLRELIKANDLFGSEPVAGITST
ncbi:MAG: hypothetical protein IH586_03900 [Anaerolineaceae bacterium]|nr:hypothetical protein [Anaerolineaceae bacterium]